MKTNDIFDINRFARLFRQNLVHNYRMIITTLVAVCGGLFIIMMFSQVTAHFRAWGYQEFIATFTSLFIVLGILYAGSAFPGFRSKEKGFSYLMTPASVFEKYLFEIVARIIFFIILLPVIYWLVFVIEGNIMRIFHPGYAFHNVWFFNRSFSVPPDVQSGWFVVIGINLCWLIFMIPFTGASAFMKHPLVKTLFAIAIIFFFHVLLVYFFMEILGFGHHMVHSESFLFMSDKQSIVRFAGIYLTLINLGLIAASFFKLKEREV